MDAELRIYQQICQLVLNGLRTKVEAIVPASPFGEEMRVFDRIRKTCHGGSPGINGEHVFDVLEAGIREPEKYAFIAAFRISKALDDIDLFLGVKLRSWYRKAEVVAIEKFFSGRPGTYLLNYWNFNYEEGREHTVAAVAEQ